MKTSTIVLWFITGFVIALVLADNLSGGYWVLLTFIAGLIFKVLAQSLFGDIFRDQIGALHGWIDKHPIDVQFYHHARKWAEGEHPTHSPIKCPYCQLTIPKSSQ